jgi:hypothetical protein
MARRFRLFRGLNSPYFPRYLMFCVGDFSCCGAPPPRTLKGVLERPNGCVCSHSHLRKILGFKCGFARILHYQNKVGVVCRPAYNTTRHYYNHIITSYPTTLIVTSHHITSHHITSHHITTSHLVSAVSEEQRDLSSIENICKHLSVHLSVFGAQGCMKSYSTPLLACPEHPLLANDVNE